MAINLKKQLKCVNANKVGIATIKGYVIIDKITPPKYYTGDEEFSEYDIRNLQLEIAKGNIPFDVVNSLEIRDDRNEVIEFRSDGCIVNRPYGFNISAELAIELMSFKNKNNNILSLIKTK
jgi:hypothetical protein